MRDVYKALADFETAFEKEYSLSLNEAMVLCALQESGREMTASAIGERTGMTPSNVSKVIRSVEDKGLIQRSIGQVDKRQMNFCLTDAGKERLHALSLEKVPIPQLFRPLVDAH